MTLGPGAVVAPTTQQKAERHLLMLSQIPRPADLNEGGDAITGGIARWLAGCIAATEFQNTVSYGQRSLPFTFPSLFPSGYHASDPDNTAPLDGDLQLGVSGCLLAKVERFQ